MEITQDYQKSIRSQQPVKIGNETVYLPYQRTTNPASSDTVICPGFSGLSRIPFEENIEPLGECSRVFALDIPPLLNIRPSLATPNPSLELRVEVLGKFIESITRRGRALNLIGYSSGGIVSMEYSIRNQEKVSRLVLVASAGFGKGISWGYWSAAFLASVPGVKNLLSRESELSIQKSLKKLFHQEIPRGLSKKILKERNYYNPKDLRDWQIQSLREGIGLWGQKLIYTGVLREIAERIPVLLIHGKHDKIIPSQHTVNAWKATYEMARMLLMKDCGHWPQMEDSERFNTEIIKFFQN